MFQIVHGAGFKMTFANGYTISVQFRPGNYCDNRDMKAEMDMYRTGSVGPNVPGMPVYQCPNAEVAVMDPSGEFIRHPSWTHGDDVKGWVSPDEVAALIAWISGIGAPEDNSPSISRG